MDTPTPMDRASIICILDTSPPVISSTWLLSTWTAGSASTTTMPMMKARAISSTGLCAAICVPILKPMGMKAISTAARNSTRPTKVCRMPTRIWISLVRGSFRMMAWRTKKNTTISTSERATFSIVSTNRSHTPSSRMASIE